jgi:uncharacterized protein
MSEKTTNAFVWCDIPVTNLDRAIKFYSEVLGQPVKKESMPGMAFGLLPHANDSVSGCLVEMKDRKPSADGPLVYLNAEGRLDAALAAVTANGGKIVQPKHPIGPYGFRAVFQDTEGNNVALHSH